MFAQFKFLPHIYWTPFLNLGSLLFRFCRPRPAPTCCSNLFPEVEVIFVFIRFSNAHLPWELSGNIISHSCQHIKHFLSWRGRQSFSKTEKVINFASQHCSRVVAKCTNVDLSQRSSAMPTVLLYCATSTTDDLTSELFAKWYKGNWFGLQIDNAGIFPQKHPTAGNWNSWILVLEEQGSV